jgi:uncharacterized protein
MERIIDAHLQAWKTSTRRKPLILNGARQVGKTYALQNLGKTSYKNIAYFNFERDERLAGYFVGSLGPKELVNTLSLHSRVDIEPHNTLIIFDEIQECPRALNSLKYFCEEANEYHLAAAGSLLGVKTSGDKSFPVGKINFLSMYPLTFFEFLSALGENKLKDYLEKHIEFIPMPEPLHEQYNTILKQYFFIGGMPEVVKTYLSTKDFNQVREVQFEILGAYERDFAKHAPHTQIMNITTVWNFIHRQLAKENKKFVFSAIRKSARGRDYEQAIQWLVDAGLIYKSYHVNTPRLPLSAYTDTNIFKLFLFDVGLLAAKSHLSKQTIIEGNRLFTEFKGALTENYAAQALTAYRGVDLHYWTSQGTAEIDFVIEANETIYPLEVKAGVSSKKKSLLVYGDRYPDCILSRATLNNLRHDGRIYNYPLYLLEKFPFANA